MSTSPKSDRQQSAHESVEFPATLTEGNAGEIGRLLIVLLREHRHTLKQRLPEISKLAQYAYGEDYRIGWN